MGQHHSSQNQQLHAAFFVKPMAVGAIIALLVISFFIFSIDAPHPEWPKLWILRPLLLTPVAGALGGAFYGFMNYQCSRGFNRALAILLSIMAYCIGLWLGTVLGLAGTMWD